MAKIESEGNKLVVECAKKDASQLELVVHVRSYGMEAGFQMVATMENFEKFLTQIQRINETQAGMAELTQLFEDKRIAFEGDGWLSMVDGEGVGRIIVSGHNYAHRNKGNEYKFQFIAGHTALVEFLWELSEMRG
jgi:hypothetical protein